MEKRPNPGKLKKKIRKINLWSESKKVRNYFKADGHISIGHRSQLERILSGQFGDSLNKKL